jgi:hypothetical protein
MLPELDDKRTLRGLWWSHLVTPAGLILEIHMRERLPGAVADDEAGVIALVERPRRREAACGGLAQLDLASAVMSDLRTARNEEVAVLACLTNLVRP